jgi:hypothetical protein
MGYCQGFEAGNGRVLVDLVASPRAQQRCRVARSPARAPCGPVAGVAAESGGESPDLGQAAPASWVASPSAAESRGALGRTAAGSARGRLGDVESRGGGWVASPYAWSSPPSPRPLPGGRSPAPTEA